MIPMQLVSKIKDAENTKHGESDDFLNDLELVGREGLRSNAIRRNLQAVFEESDRPTDEDDLPESDVPELQMPVPGEGHEDVRTN